MKETDKQIWTIIDLVHWGTDYFSKKGISSPRLNIELLLCELLNIERINIYTQFDRPLTVKELDELKKMVLRRSKREPLQYIIGKTNFFGCQINVNNSSIVPRPETESLIEEVIKSYPDKEKQYRILDIGTGTGCIAIALAKHFPNSQIDAIDISFDAIELAKSNSILNTSENIIFSICDILNNQNNFNNRYDIIVSNPPYIKISDYLELQPEILNFEPKFALTDDSDGLTFYRKFAAIFPELLNSKGKFFLEIASDQSEYIMNIFPRNNFDITIINDLSSKPRVVIGRILTQS